MLIVDDHIAGERPKTVLIVDDEPAVGEGIAMLLESEGFHTATILEGAGTVAAIERRLPDLVLLDIGLPDVSGLDVFKDIQARWPALPVIFMSGHYSRSNLGAVLDLPHVGFLEKPFGAGELLLALESARAT